ncbi:MAG: 50S ribosomal protein L13 [Elusimicrobia bacterium]|nr:50S ribosomal protein L13 [Elusimicrobiota bacterium]
MAAQKTTIPGKEQIKKTCYLVDADGKTLGRLATKVAKILMGKNKPTYVPHMETGDSVVIVNAEKIRVTGKKMTDKYYDRYTGYHSGIRRVHLSDMLDKRPVKVLELAIKRMLPKSKLADRIKTRLFVYAGPDHPHKAQKPVPLAV